MMDATRAAAHETLVYYIIDAGNAQFRLQHIVDGAAAETAGPTTKPITIVFALIGLYLHVEKNWTGAAIQKAHSRLARNRRTWPAISLPSDRGPIAMSDLVSAAAGSERDRLIEDWCASLWQAYRDSHDTIRALAHAELGADLA